MQESNMNDQNNKTNLRIKLEHLENQIHISWIRDLDKTKELKEINLILESLYKTNNFEEFFNNVTPDIVYFFQKFSKEVVNNILRQPIIYGEKGDDIAIQVLTSFMKLFSSLVNKSYCAASIYETMKDILDHNKSFYKGTISTSQKSSNEKKQLSFEKFNEMFLKKKKKSEVNNNGKEDQEQFKVNDIIDILINNTNVYYQFNDKKVWVRGIVKEVNELSYKIFTVEHGLLEVEKDSFSITTKGKMTKDYDWRISRNLYDNVDGFDRGKWYPSTIVKVEREDVQGLCKVNYTLGFRLYIDKFPKYQEYEKYFSNRYNNISIDKKGMKYIGDMENMDENISYSSIKMQPFNTMLGSNKDDINNTDNILNDLLIDDQVEYIIKEYNVANDNIVIKKSAIVGKGKSFNFYYALLLKNFYDVKGFDLLINKLKEIFIKNDNNNNNNNNYNEVLVIVYSIFSEAFNYFHIEYKKEIATILYNVAKEYFNMIVNDDVKNIKKDVIDLIIKVLKQYFNVIDKYEEINNINNNNNNNKASNYNTNFLNELEDFSITLSIKLLKTNSLDKRIQAIKTIVELVKNSSDSKPKNEKILKLIDENNVFNEIFGHNSHIQLINKSQELLEIMIKSDRLSENEFELIWNATNKGDLEGKLTILKLLKELSKAMKNKHLDMLLQKIYSTKSNELINEEIDVSFIKLLL